MTFEQCRFQSNVLILNNISIYYKHFYTDVTNTNYFFISKMLNIYRKNALKNKNYTIITFHTIIHKHSCEVRIFVFLQLFSSKVLVELLCFLKAVYCVMGMILCTDVYNCDASQRFTFSETIWF